MTKKPDQVRITQKKTVHMYAELWHASKCVLERGIENEKGSSWQFLSSIVLTAFAFEAYLNHVGKSLIACWESVEPLPPPKKFNLICELLKVDFPGEAGKRPVQTLTQLQDFRNLMAHGKTEQIEPQPFLCDAKHADARLGQRPLANWERLIRTKDFAERARVDVEEVLKTVHAARPKPKESLFSFGIGSGSAVVVENDGRNTMRK